MTGDGFPDLIGAGFGYTSSAFDRAEPSSWIRVAAWLGGDPEDPNSYSVRSFDTSSPVDTAHFNLVVRDSAGVITTFHERARSKFATKIAYLGDADNDGEEIDGK